MSQFDESKIRRDAEGKFATKGPAAEAGSVELDQSAPASVLDSDIEEMETQLRQIEEALGRAQTQRLGQDLKDRFGPDATVHMVCDTDATVYVTKVTRSGGRSETCSVMLPRGAWGLPGSVRRSSFEQTMKVSDMVSQTYEVPGRAPAWDHNVVPSEMATRRVDHAMEHVGWGSGEDSGYQLFEALVDLRHWSKSKGVDFDSHVADSQDTYDDEQANAGLWNEKGQ